MRSLPASICALLLTLAAGALVHAQDADRVIPGGGIHIAGWKGKIDPGSARQGRVLSDSRLAQDGAAIRATTGPAVTYWNPANTAAGDYTVKATFLEPKFMDGIDHPHSYGLFIGGNGMDTDQMSLVYCVTYGDGQALVRGFAPAVFTLLRAMPNPAVRKAAAVGQPVTQDIAWRVKGGRAECLVNGTVVAGYDRAALVGPGKLRSTDGVYGLRLTHNVEAVVTGLTMTRN